MLSFQKLHQENHRYCPKIMKNVFKTSEKSFNLKTENNNVTKANNIIFQLYSQAFQTFRRCPKSQEKLKIHLKFNR